MNLKDHTPKPYGQQGCPCNECHEIHSEFIEHFGHWPNKTHDQGQALKRGRIENEDSWQRLMRGTK